MDYQETVSWMFRQLPMYQNVGKSAYKVDLSNTLNLSSHLNNPEKKFKSIHVAGTNGKGSVSHMLASIFQEAGYNVGLYTSPHLKDFRERIKINGIEVSEDFVVEFISRNKPFLEKNNFSFFEMTVGMAFQYFAVNQVDVAVIEVGLGGRLDSTNIITPEVSVITNIGMDHTTFLGDTLEQIAVEKAGIIKQGIPVVIGETQPETKNVFKEIAKKNESEIYFADQNNHGHFETDLKGSYQSKNIPTVLQTCSILKGAGFNISETHLRDGLLKVVSNTGLRGRWEKLQESPLVICDTAHNKEGLQYVLNQLLHYEYDQLRIVFGTVRDKNLDSILAILPKEAMYYLCKPNVDRGLDADQLQTIFHTKGFNSKIFQSVIEAYRSALQNASKDDLIFVGGSTFVVAEVI